MFNKDVLESWLGEIGKTLTRELTIYLIGGGAMCFKGIKLMTKDIDLVLLQMGELKELSKALKNGGYKQPTELEDFYLSAISVFERESNRIDIFVRDICKQLFFTDRMAARAEFYKKLGKVKICLAANEDIFLFKAITDREKDIDDCLTLLGTALDNNKITEEIEKQKERTHWCFFVYEKLCLIQERLGVTFPLKEQIKKVCKKISDKAPSGFLDGAADKKTHWP